MTDTPICPFCHKALSLNPQTNSYECLSCTFQNLENKEVIEQPPISLENFPEDLREHIQIEEFRKKFHAQKSSSPATKILFALNTLVFLFISIKGNDFFNPSNNLLLDYGASNGIKIFDDNEWWRLFSSMFLHGGLTHILFNMLALWTLGNFVEKLYGKFAFTTIYFCSGIFAGLLSLYNNAIYTVGVGASGAIFGLFGALIAFAIFKNMPKSITKAILKDVIITIALNLVIGLSLPQIDNSAHLGGAVAGFILGTIIGQDLTKLNHKKRLLTSCFSIALTTIFTFSTWQTIGTKNKKNIDPRYEKMIQEENAIDQAIKKFDDLEKLKENELLTLLLKFTNGKIDNQTFKNSIENDFYLVFKNEGDKLKQLLDNKLIKENFKKYISTYLELQSQYFQKIQQYGDHQDPKILHEAKLLKEKYLNLKIEDF